MKKTWINFSILLCFFIFKNGYANNPVYTQRQADYITTSIANGTSENNILKAKLGLPLDTTELNDILQGISTGTTSDFDIIKLIRILYFTNGVYDAQILPVLNSVPYWINKGDTVRNYWSENHMIMWMSSDWLLHEKYGRAIDNTLDARLRHYLELKVTYGFYEFFSTVYAPYALSGLLNLADFAQDAQIKQLATKAAQRLLTDMLLLTNNQGTFFPTAGRNYTGKYFPPYGQNHNHLIYLLTAMGDIPSNASQGGAFLATSSLAIDSVVASWKPTIDTLYTIGHSLDSGLVLNSGMSSVDKVVFQWSSGAYFHPKVVLETAKLLSDSNLWKHVDFALLRPIANLPISIYEDLAEGLGVISKSSVISGQQLSIYKHHSISLSSIRDFWKGKAGYQQFPCVANVGSTAVFTASGQVKKNWTARNSNNANTHLPYVFQKKNVALLMYRPEPTPDIIGPAFSFKDVALHWREQDFDETATDSLWLLGRQNESYVAVKRSCVSQTDSVWACATDVGQTWVIMVGDSGLHGSFTNFKNVVHAAQFQEKWYYDTASSQYVYFAKISVDSVTIDYAWGVDSMLTTGISETTKQPIALSLYPNPAADILHIAGVSVADYPSVSIYNSLGILVYKDKTSATVSTRNFAAGVYTLWLEGDRKLSQRKQFVVNH